MAYFFLGWQALHDYDDDDGVKHNKMNGWIKLDI
jgi:hypothetical protein